MYNTCSQPPYSVGYRATQSSVFVWEPFIITHTPLAHHTTALNLTATLARPCISTTMNTIQPSNPIF